MHYLGIEIVASISTSFDAAPDTSAPSPTPLSPDQDDESSASDEDILPDVQFLTSECNFADHADDLMLALSLHEFACSVDSNPDSEEVYRLHPSREQLL